MRKILYTFIICLLAAYFPVAAQKTDSSTASTLPSVLPAQKTEKDVACANRFPAERVSVKMNALLAIGVINPGIEFSVHKHITVEMEGMGVFFNKNFLGTGVPLVLATTFFEGRYYLKEAYRGFYAGPNIGWGVWKMNKDIAPGYNYGHSSIQYGCNVMMGLTLGYQWVLSKHWSIDFCWGLGWQHAIYDGFQDSDNDGIWETYFDNSIPKGQLNRSSEWMPAYKGGAFISYRF